MKTLFLHHALKYIIIIAANDLSTQHLLRSTHKADYNSKHLLYGRKPGKQRFK